MGAVRRPDEPRLLPYRLAHRGRYDGIVAGGKRQHRAFQSVFNVSRVPMHQPFESFMETRDIERVCPRKVRGTAGAPKSLHGRVRLALDPALPATRAIGLRELIRHLDGEIGLDEAVQLAQVATRRYAKRQMTWFRNQLHDPIVLDAQYSERVRQESFSKIEAWMLTPPEPND